MNYIWQLKDWPKMTWASHVLLPILGQARLAQGNLLGRMKRMGFQLGDEARADILSEEAIKTSAIEGEHLNPRSVRSSIARQLGMSTTGLGPVERSVDGLISVLLNATQQHHSPLTDKRLKGWHAALFPTGYSGFHKIQTGHWRGKEPMRIVSGPVGREKIHFEAPPGQVLNAEMKQFLRWFNAGSQKLDGLLRAGLAHFYFVTIHPFEDGNGRLARALTDMALSQDEKLGTRYYSLSSQIMEDRESYYDILEKMSKSHSLDVTNWLAWFLDCYKRAIDRSDQLIGQVAAKADFWHTHSQTNLNDRQRKVINRLLDAGKTGFEGGLTTRKYVSLTKTSRATAFREISELVQHGMLHQNSAKGRSVSYTIQWS